MLSAFDHDAVDAFGDEAVVVFWIGEDFAFGDFTAAWHGVCP